MFIAFLEKVFRKLRWEKKGIKIGSENLTHPRFADDIIIFANSMEKFQEMLHELNQASLEVGLSMNLKKTIYLGQCISMDSDSKEHEIKRRITLGWRVFGRASTKTFRPIIP